MARRRNRLERNTVNAHHIQITETQAEALREILFAFDELNRVPETPAEQIVFPVESPSSPPPPPWVVNMWNQMLDRIPQHKRAFRMHEGTHEACWAVQMTATDVTHWQGIRQSAEEINMARVMYQHPRIWMGKSPDKMHVKVYDREQWAR